MKIGIISIYDFPYGMAATNRIAAYSQGLSENGVDVTVINVLPTQRTADNIPNAGNYNGVSYIHLCGRKRSKYKLARFFAHYFGFRFLNGLFAFYNYLKQNSFDLFIISNDAPLFLLCYNVLCKIHKSKTIFIFDEYPTPIRHKLKDKIPNWKQLFYKFVLRRYDGYISISNELKKYYNHIVEKPTIIIPLIVNTRRFQYKKVEKNTHISYVGNMELSKDNIDNIIRAFSIVVKKYSEYTLHFYGNTTKKTIEILKQLIHSLHLENFVFLHGYISSEAVPQIILESKLMVSSQPNTTRAKGGFPTKLGEYIVMGTPTLICDVGENKLYLNESDCFYAKPEDPNDYASKLVYIIEHYDEAINIANAGRNKILGNYTQTIVGKRIKQFLTSIK